MHDGEVDPPVLEEADQVVDLLERSRPPVEKMTGRLQVAIRSMSGQSVADALATFTTSMPSLSMSATEASSNGVAIVTSACRRTSSVRVANWSGPSRVERKRGMCLFPLPARWDGWMKVSSSRN